MIVRASIVIAAVWFFLTVPNGFGFEEEGHFHLTWLAARMAGLSAEDALRVASACQAADESRGSDPIPHSTSEVPYELKRMLAAQVNVHAFRGPGGNVESVRGPTGEAEILERMNVLSTRATQTKDLDRLGVYLHFLGDYNAHQHDGQHLAAGLGQVTCAVELSGHGEKSEKIKSQALKDFAEGVVARKPFLSADAMESFVQQAVPDSHWVDHIESRSDATTRLLKQLYYQTRKFAEATSYQTKSTAISETQANKIIEHLSSYVQGVNYHHDSGQDFSEVLNNYLSNQGIKNVSVPKYRNRIVDVVIDAEGNPAKIPKMTASDLVGANVVQEPTGSKGDRAVETQLSATGTSVPRMVSAPLSPDVRTQVAAADSVKGVRIKYDPGVLRQAIATARTTPALTADPLADDVITKVRASPTTLAVRIDEVIAAISLTRLYQSQVSADAQTLGGIERIIGYVVDAANDDIIALGTLGTHRLNIDDVSVILKQVWQGGQTPLCSLDPKPGQGIEAGFISRVEGVPRNSRAGLVMLDADYAMKRVNMGLDHLALPNFHSVYDYQVEAVTVRSIEGGSGTDHIARFWLTPIEPQKGDIRVSTGGRLVLFTSRVQLLTEIMLLASDGLIGTHKTDPAEEEGCNEFTRRYSEIAAARGEFADLQALFDLTLMANLLRQHVPSCGILALLADRPVQPTPLDETKYRVLRQNLSGRPFYVGGVHVEFSNAQQAVSGIAGNVVLRALAKELIAAPSLDQRGSSKRGLLQDAIKTYWAAQEEIESGRTSAAIRTLNKAEQQLSDVIKADSECLSAFLLRAFIRITKGDDLQEAINDCNAVILSNPKLSRAALYKGIALLKLVAATSDTGERTHMVDQAEDALNQAVNAQPDDNLAVGTRGTLQQFQASALSGALYTLNFNNRKVIYRSLSGRPLQLITQSELDFGKAESIADDAESRSTWRTQKGWCKALRGDARAALNDFQNGIARNDPLSLSYAANVYVMLGDYANADSYATRAIDKSGQSFPLAFEIRALAKFAQGNIAGAREDLEMCLRMQPGRQDIVQLLNKF